MSASALASDDQAGRVLQPFQICVGPAAETAVRRVLREEVLPGARLLPFVDGLPPAISGPAILVLSPQDLRGPNRERLLDLAHAARPGRPILYGGTTDRDVLLDAINTWRVIRIVAESPRPGLLADAIRKSQEALEIECGLEHAVADLRRDTQSQEQALRRLRETQEQLRHAERLATLGRITSSLIPVIAAHLEALQEFNASVANGPQRRDPRLEELLGYAFTGIRSLHAMLDEVKGYAESRAEVYRLELEDADEVVRFAVSFSRYDPAATRLRLNCELRARTKIRGDCFRLYQTIINLLRNAFQATPPGGEVMVRCWSEDADVIIDVENSGEPIPADVKARLFEPFFSTKGEQGMGLGLSMCRTTVERHGGTISCTSDVGERTRFRIRLPKAE
jgi:signal transduction histidine kinase